MYSTCPKCGYHNAAENVSGIDTCPACGLVFSKYLQNLVASEAQASAPSRSESRIRLHPGALLLPTRPGVGRLEIVIYALIWVGLLLWGLDFIGMDFRSNAIGQSWFHNVNLIFHEAGHMIFRPFGRTMMILGGSLFQVLVPLMLMGVFLSLHRDGFAAAVCLWWVGQSLMDVAPYIADARALRLPLLGGGTGADSPGMHDWANLLRPRGWLQYDIQIADVVDKTGSGLILLALAWGAWMLLVYYRKAKEQVV